MTWYEELGLKENPFDVRPKSAVIIGLEREKEKLLDFINSGSIVALIGETGTGKTSLIKHLMQNELKGKSVYLDCEDIDKIKNLNIAEELKKLNKLFFIKPKRITLFLDEGHLAPVELLQKAKAKYQNSDDNLYSIVLIQIAKEATKLDSFNERISSFIQIHKLTRDELKEIVGFRLNELKLFSDNVLDYLIEKSNYNPRKLLILCDSVLRNSKNVKNITPDDVKRVLVEGESSSLKPRADVEIRKSNVKEVLDFQSFSPMQRKMIEILFNSEKTTNEISDILEKPIRSVSKQISLLRAKNVVEWVPNTLPKKFKLEENFRISLINR